MIRSTTLIVGDFRPRSYADKVACDVAPHTYLESIHFLKRLAMDVRVHLGDVAYQG
ncbi:MAG: hypothetical protein ABIR39_15755 [Nocardioides sp.]|uniref:hypothetical protein n=1 Tax=Nocardioides sp. TaxID=35761 RepID=UPI003265C2C5